MGFHVVAHRDAALAEAFERRAGWLRGSGEVLRRMAVHPQGWFRAVEDDGRTIGTCACVSWPSAEGASGGLAWIGGMVVVPEARRRGVARALLESCLAYARARGASTVGLDATAMAQPLYESVGFRVVSTCSRWGRTDGARGAPPRQAAALYPASTCEIMDLARYDAPRFGADRARWLASVIAELPHRCFVAFDRPSGTIVGYILGQEEFVGPLVADRPEVAAQLLHAAQSAGAPARVHVADNHDAALAMVRDAGFLREPSVVTRMTLGGPMPGRPEACFAAAAWALG